MNKLNKLFAIIIAVLGVQTLSAQTDVTSTYLTNAGFDDESGWKTSNVAVTSGGNMQDIPGWTKKAVGWSSAATFGYGGGGQVNGSSVPSTGPDGASNGGAFGFSGSWEADIVYTQAVTLPAGFYTLSYKVFNAQTSTDGNNKLKTNKFGFVASSGKTFYGATTTFASSSWTEANTSFVLTTETSGNISIGAAFPGASSSVTPRLIVDGVTLTYKSFDDISAENPADFTPLIVNPSFETGNLNGWTYKSSSDTGVKSNSDNTYKTTGVDGNYLYNTWWQGTPLTQTVADLPNGIYELKVLLASDQNAKLFLLANDEHSEVYTITTDNKTFHDVSYEFKVLNGQAKIGVVGGNDAGEYVADGYWWYKADNFRLTYKGIDLSIIKEAYETALANATAARDNSEYSNVVGVEKTNLLNAISLQPAENKSELEAATAALLNATTAFTASKPDYDALAAEKIIAAGLGLSEESIASAAATTKTGLVALQDLKEAEYNYIQGTYTEEATLVSWTEDFNSDLDGEGYKAGGPKYLDDWTANKTTRTTKQTVTLPAGDYALSVIARGQAGASGNLYYKIGDVTTDVALIMKGNRGRGVDVNGVANFSEEGEYNCNGEGFGWEYRFITFHLDAETEVEIGASITIQGQWASVYAPVLLTTESSVKAFRMTKITNLLGTVPTGKMNATVQSTLNEKKDAAEAASAEGNTIDELSAIATELKEAIIAANASIAEYAKLEGYISMTKVFTDVTQYEQKYENGEFAADEVEIVRQELNVMRYNAASAVFTNKIEVTDWTGDLANGTRSDQHWSGNTQNYYDANSWTANFVGLKHTLSTTITLPNGTYVLKAAGRSSSDATLRLTIKNGDTVLESVEYTGKGDQGYGIDTSGAANFSEEGTYANNDNGRGWEWEFAKFELDAETTVTLHVEVDYNNIQNRFGSFSDITLWMDDETYVAVNGGAINAPLAAAKALVDTKPMGGAENTALQNAIAQAEGTISTPAELDGAIAALETAVANANAWVVAYNEAKAPLVTALERFEYGFNNGAEGRQIPLTDDTWNALLEAVEGAAVAKDVTDSYSGFEGATTDFNTMMDWATNKDFSMANQLDCTSFIGNADCANNDAWTGNGRTVLSGEHWSGPSRNYFAQNFEPGEARTQVVSLPYSGWYYLRVSVRAVNAGSYCTIIVDGEEYTVNGAHGSVGGTIATDGTEWPSVAKGIAAGKSFANDNKGYGWVYMYIPFKVENATKDVTIKIALSNKDQNRQAYCGGMDLFYTGKNCHVKEGREVVHHGNYTDAGSFEAFYTTHNVTAATMSAVSVTPTNPNALIIANEGQVKDGTNNVVVNNACASLSLTDGAGYDFDAINTFEATEVSYNRSFAADTWLTICLPFDVEIPADVKVEALTSVDLATKTFTFDEVTGTMAANTPYLIKNSSETAQLFASLGAKSVAATTEIKSNVKATDESTNIDFCGTFTTVTSTELMEDGTYDILFFGNDGQLYYLSDGVDNADKVVTFKPFRTYLRVEKGAINWSDGVAARVRHGGDATGIEDIIENEDSELVIYDLMGRRVNTMQKGSIYIINGKKVLNK